MSFRPIVAINDLLAPTVAKAFTRDSTTVRRFIENIDAEILSQYARLLSIKQVILRTANMDMLSWLCAGLDAPPTAYLDERLPPLLATSEIKFAGHWVLAGTGADLNKDNREDVSVILADRADIIQFSDELLADISSIGPQFLVIYDVKDLPTQDFIKAARESEIKIEIIPAHRSFAVCDLDGSSCSSLKNCFKKYIGALREAPEHLRPRVQKEGDWPLLIELAANALRRSYDAATAANKLLGAEAASLAPAHISLDGDFAAQALNLAGALCRFLDQEANPISRMVSQEYRDQARKTYQFLQQSSGGDEGLIRNHFLDCYETIWKVLHVIASLAHHSLSQNKTVRLAVDPFKNGVIAPRPYKPFGEYIFFYRFQEFRWRKYAKNMPAKPFIRWEIGNNIDHYTRIWQAVALIEILFMIIRRERPNETIRWLDLGCSEGLIANLVRLEECLPDRNWQIVGVDWNVSAIEIACKRAGPHRTFLVGDVKEATTRIGGDGFHIVSAFEFVEHLEDPVTTIHDCTVACLDYFVAGSPRSERQGWLPVANHIWTFDRQGFEDICRAAGLTPTFANEALIGSYCGGADWLTVVCGRNRKLPQNVGSIS
jgi:hypothetical protein